MHKSRNILIISISLFIILIFSGCVTKALEIPEYNYFTDFSTDNIFYSYIPVQANKEFIKSLAYSFDKTLLERDLEMFLNKTSAIYLAFKTNLKKEREVQIIAAGYFPKIFIISTIKKDDWEKFENYYTNGDLNLLFYDQNKLAISNKNPNLITPQNKNKVKMERLNRIEFLADDPLNFMRKFLGDIILPVKRVRGFVTNITDKEIITTIQLEFSEIRGIKPAKLILSKLLNNSKIEQLNDSTISITNVKISKAKMEDLWTQK